MAVLTHPTSWRRIAKRDVEADLTPAEQESVRRAIRFLAKQHATYANLASAMKAKRGTILAAARGVVSAGIALRAARVPLEDVLLGAWPSATACPPLREGMTR